MLLTRCLLCFAALTLAVCMALKVLKQLNLPSETHFSLCDENGDLERVRKPWEILPAGHKIGAPYPLFKELVSMILYQQFFVLQFSFFVLFCFK